MILQEYKIQDTALRKIGELIHAIEINNWQGGAPEQALELNQKIIRIKEQFKSPIEIFRVSFPVFQELYDSLNAGTYERFVP